jgi:hypothetical protein
MSQPAAVPSASLARSPPRCQAWSSRPRAASMAPRGWSSPERSRISAARGKNATERSIARRKEGVDLRPRPTAAPVRLDRTTVAHVGTGRASAVRADRCRTVSGDVRQKAEYGSVMPILSVGVRWGRAIGWLCKSEAAGSNPARSISRKIYLQDFPRLGFQHRQQRCERGASDRRIAVEPSRMRSCHAVRLP